MLNRIFFYCNITSSRFYIQRYILASFVMVISDLKVRVGVKNNMWQDLIGFLFELNCVHNFSFFSDCDRTISDGPGGVIIQNRFPDSRARDCVWVIKPAKGFTSVYLKVVRYTHGWGEFSLQDSLKLTLFCATDHINTVKKG